MLGAEPVLPASNADLVVGNGQELIIQYPVDSISFGWLDGISISRDTAKPDSFFVLIPQPNEDPWSTHAPTLTFYHLEANSTAGAEEGIPGSTSRILCETFMASVPLSTSASPTSTSSSASAKFVIGRHHTALWLSPGPRDWDLTGLVQMDLNRQGDWPYQARSMRSSRNLPGDDLVWASFGPRRTKAKPQAGDDGNRESAIEEDNLNTSILMNRILNSDGKDWTAIGYDEETGRVALGRRDGYITLLSL